jgi:hypothetical protein
MNRSDPAAGIVRTWRPKGSTVRRSASLTCSVDGDVGADVLLIAGIGGCTAVPSLSSRTLPCGNR